METLTVEGSLVTFRWTYVVHGEEGATTLTSTSTLRFRDQQEVEDDVRRAGFMVIDVREAPGQEFVVIARHGPAEG